MTRLLMMSDTHNRHELIKEISYADVLLHAGDFTLGGTDKEIMKFNDWLGSLDRLFPTGFPYKVVVPGNHDILFEKNWDHAEALLNEAIVLDQSSVEINGLTIYGEPRQPEFLNWAYNIPRPDMKDIWEKVPKNIDILLTHGPPFGIGDKTKKGEHVGCVHQRAWIEENQPKLVVCGHIHEGYGLYMVGRTLVVNASVCTSKYQPWNKPFVIDL